MTQRTAVTVGLAYVAAVAAVVTFALPMVASATDGDASCAVDSDCNDGNACTFDSCDQTTSKCSHEALKCLKDKNPCTADPRTLPLGAAQLALSGAVPNLW